MKSAEVCRGKAVILSPAKEDIKQRWTKCIAKAYIRLHGRERDANTGEHRQRGEGRLEKAEE